MEASNPISNNDEIGKSLADLAITNLWITQWQLRLNTGSFGWINTSDISLLEKVKTHADVLTQTDINDQNFRELLSQSITNDIRFIINVWNTQRKSAIIDRFLTDGGMIEAAPMRPVSAPSSVFFILPGREPEIIASWERLYLSVYEPFAVIYCLQLEILFIGKVQKLQRLVKQKD
jgi:hypothetical protein